MATIAADVVDDALASLSGPVRRPPLPTWLRYALNGSIPAEYRVWVLKDVTASTWVLRHAFRTLVILIVPAVAVLLFLPTSLEVRLLTLANAAPPAFLGSMLFTISACERRLLKAGYPAELGEAVRHTRSVRNQIEGNRARRERIAERRARRAG